MHVDRRVGRLVFSDYNSASLLYYVSVLIFLAFTTYVGLGVDALSIFNLIVGTPAYFDFNLAID